MENQSKNNSGEGCIKKSVQYGNAPLPMHHVSARGAMIPAVNRFKDALLSREHFVCSYELVPAWGSRGTHIDDILTFAKQARQSGLLDSLSLTDNPGGEPALSPDILGKELLDIGITPIIHFSAKDENRNSIESRALALDRAGLANLLVMTGDYPSVGDQGIAKPVFDLDSVQLLDLLHRMNEGLPMGGKPGKNARLERTSFFLGCVVSPFKTTEPEIIMQYFKLEKKLRAGADFIVTQLGYDTRKYREIIDYLRWRNITTPLVGSVFVLRAPIARLMNRGGIPGCIVTDDLLALVEEESRSSDRGKQAAFERAARQVAVLKGLGFHGVHIEGFGLSFDDVRMIIERSHELEPGWEEWADSLSYSPTGTFHLIGYDSEKIICDPSTKPMRPLIRFSAMWLFHRIFFKQGTPGYRLMRRLSIWLDTHPRALRLFHGIERLSKVLLFDCQDCGDCVLPELHFLCPESKCPKFQRVGPCGGSDKGRCEVFPDRYCIWYPVYIRAKCTGTVEELRKYFVPPRDWTLSGTSSWINYFLHRDHTGKQQ